MYHNSSVIVKFLLHINLVIMALLLHLSEIPRKAEYQVKITIKHLYSVWFWIFTFSTTISVMQSMQNEQNRSTPIKWTLNNKFNHKINLPSNRYCYCVFHYRSWHSIRDISKKPGFIWPLCPVAKLPKTLNIQVSPYIETSRHVVGRVGHFKHFKLMPMQVDIVGKSIVHIP